MAGSFGGFSIREYALKMRSEDISKCWPFSTQDSSGGAIAREVAESLLPPISVTKFRWWSRELEVVRSAHNDLGACGFVPGGSSSLERLPRASSGEPPRSEIITFDCPVCGVLTAATVSAVNAHVDGCLARQEEKRQLKAAKTKPRGPKKRSIVEIFAMSPQVQRVSGGEGSTVVEDGEDEEDEGEERREDMSSPRRAMDAMNLRKKKVKKKKNTVWASVSAVGKIHKKKKKKKKKNNKKNKKLKKISGNGSTKISGNGSIRKVRKLRHEIMSVSLEITRFWFWRPWIAWLLIGCVDARDTIPC